MQHSIPTDNWDSISSAQPVDSHASLPLSAVMSKQPPAPILKMDLLSSAIAGDATPHRVQATAVFDPTDIHVQEALLVASSPATGCLPCLPLVCLPSPPVQAFAARSPLLAGLPIGMWVGQMWVTPSSQRLVRF